MLNRGTTIAVIIPISAIASPLTAPSTAPISIALDVPSPCEQQPSARPFATGVSIWNIRIIIGPKTVPMKPQRMTVTAASETLPPREAVMSIAMGVVTDFASIDLMKSSSSPKNLHRK